MEPNRKRQPILPNQAAVPPVNTEITGSSRRVESPTKTKPKRKLIVWRKIWPETRRGFMMIVGAILAALGYSLFQIPYNIAAGGIGGISIIVNYFTGWPQGTLYLVFNIPLLILGFFYLGRWSFLVRTILSVVIFSVATDIFLTYLPNLLPAYPLTSDVLLSAVYGGLVGGVGGGLTYRAGSTMGGTGIIGRIIQNKTGVPLSQVYLYTDGVIVLAAGAIFGWEIALYAMLTLFLSGMASDYTLEGPSSVRTATIITNRADEMSGALMNRLGHGVSQWEITGGFTGEPHAMLRCTIYRPQVNDLKHIVADIDPKAFVTIGMTHQALGSKFLRLK